MVARGALSALLLGQDSSQASSPHDVVPQDLKHTIDQLLVPPSLPHRRLPTSRGLRATALLQSAFADAQKPPDPSQASTATGEDSTNQAAASADKQGPAEDQQDSGSPGEDQQDAADNAMEEYEKQMKSLGDYVTQIANAATRSTERAGMLAEQVRHETLDEEVSRSAEDMHDLLADVPWKLRAANPSIQHLYDAREDLRSLTEEGGRVDPLVEKRMLATIERDASEAMEALEAPLNSLKAARNLYDAAERHAALAAPILRENEVHMRDMSQDAEHNPVESPDAEDPLLALQRTIQGEPDARTANTAAGCNCDDQVQCSMQGRSFTWCRVGGGRCPLLSQETSTDEAGGASRPSWVDPSGTDHRLYSWPGAYPASGTHQQQSGAVWDYCTPAPKPAKGSAPKTAHGGRCAWRGDLYERYEKDDAFDTASGKLDLEKVPERDRLALEAMQLYKANPKERSLCTVTPNSGPYAVCPVSQDPDNPEAARGGWLADRSWDFCTDRTWKPNPKGDRPPLVPSLPTEEELKKATREAEKAKQALEDEPLMDAGLHPLVTLAFSSLSTLRSGKSSTAAAHRPAAPSLCHPRTVRQAGSRAAVPLDTHRLSDFLPDVRQSSLGASRVSTVP